LAADAQAIGYGGISQVAAAAGVSRTTVHAGLKDLGVDEPELRQAVGQRVRKPGAGRKSRTDLDPTLLSDLDRLLDPVTRGDPMSPLRWSVGIIRDTAEFAVETIRRWWERMGRQAYPDAKRVLITADGGGSNGARRRPWKWELRQWAAEVGVEVHVRHFPPGTSKWSKIEYRMFCHITENWRGQPLTSLMTIVIMIGATHTDQGLAIQAELDER
jgi:hypothetical protein